MYSENKKYYFKGRFKDTDNFIEDVILASTLPEAYIMITNNYDMVIFNEIELREMKKGLDLL